MTRIFKSKSAKGREWERWQDNVSKQIDDAQTLSANEMLTWFGAEPNISAENSAITERVNSLEKTLYMMNYNAQMASDAKRQAEDAAIMLWMGDI